MGAVNWVVAALLIILLVVLCVAQLANGRAERAERESTGPTSWAPGITVLPVPPLHGHHFGHRDGRYRVWTIGHGLRFDAVPPRSLGGPATVPVGPWHVSTSSLDPAMSSPSVVTNDDGRHTLHVWSGDPASPLLHDLDGTTWPTRRAADQAAYDAGVTGLMVYETKAARWGLPHLSELESNA